MSVAISARRGAVAAITGYQRYISPRKGFRCAYRVLTGGQSCSERIKRYIAKMGIAAGIRRARWQFALCREAHRVLLGPNVGTARRRWRLMRANGDANERRKNNRTGGYAGGMDICEVCAPVDAACCVADVAGSALSDASCCIVTAPCW
jgi:putative component of membrane protein insertase Oxa1/YidC/SpoIIIJ protein YidD